MGPPFTCDQLTSALGHTNQHATKGATKVLMRARQRTSQVINPTIADVDNLLEEMEVLRWSEEPAVETAENQNVEEESAQGIDKHAGQRTDQRADSFSNLATGSSDFEGQRSDDHLENSESQSSDRPVGGARNGFNPRWVSSSPRRSPVLSMSQGSIA